MVLPLNSASSSTPDSSGTTVWPAAGQAGPIRQSEMNSWAIFSSVVRVLT